MNQWMYCCWLLVGIMACASRPLEPIEKVGEEPTAIHTKQSSASPSPPSVDSNSNVKESPKVIPRYILEVIQAQGPGRFLQRVPVVPYRDRGEFIGFQIVELFPGEGIRVNSIHKGDVVTKVNGRRVDRPEQFMQLFDEVHLLNEITIHFERKGTPMNVTYQVQ